MIKTPKTTARTLPALSPRLAALLSALMMAAALLFVATGPASAMDLDQARSMGLVGERPDGLVGIVNEDGHAAEVRALVNSVNEQRLRVYQETAAKNGTPLDAVKAVAGEKQIAKARASGWFYYDTNRDAWLQR